MMHNDNPEWSPNDLQNAVRMADLPQTLRAKIGRPKAQSVKSQITLRLDADVLAAFKATGKGWQTRINDTLRASLPKL